MKNWFEMQSDCSEKMIPHALLQEKKELEARLIWIESEIKQLSNSTGLNERIQRLNYAKAQLVATLDIRRVMYEKPKI
ncbi:hypothetical protein [Rhodoferax antarcticus]|uniref:hypothetical protein n=1 Tax=Rhodoferax antarcticus TaxID=81479 RepID=UPI0011152177|nr:hypothetical protein [Rhodoferax antarcticus]